MSTFPSYIREMPGQVVDAASLEGLGREASKLSSTAGLSLTEAVVTTLEKVKLNAEQVTRVVEYANVDAWNRKFAALDPAGSRSVDIAGGPADPVQVLQSLGSASVDAGESMPDDYSSPPVKTSSFSRYEIPVRSESGVFHDISRLRSKLSSEHALAVEDTLAKKYSLNQALLSLGEAVKSASLMGASAEEIYGVWHVHDAEIAPTAFERLRHFISTDNVKVAGRAVSPDHSVSRRFATFAKCAHDYVGAVTARQQLETELTRVDTWLKEKQQHVA